MKPKGRLWLIAAGGLLLVPFAQSAPKIVPIPGDPLELAAGQIQAVGPESREAILQLLARARNSYALRSQQGKVMISRSVLQWTLTKVKPRIMTAPGN